MVSTSSQFRVAASLVPRTYSSSASCVLCASREGDTALPVSYFRQMNDGSCVQPCILLFCDAVRTGAVQGYNDE